MKLRASLLAVVLACGIVPQARAQLGVGLGAGLVAAGDGVTDAASDLQDFLSKDSLAFTNVSGSVGFTVIGRLRWSMSKVLRLNGDASVAFFSSENVQLTDARANLADTTVNATFEVGTTVIPISAGIQAGLPSGPIRPFVGADLGMTFVSRTYTFVSGNTGGVNQVEIENKRAGDPEIGLALNAGVDVTIGPVVIEIAGRYSLANMLSQDDEEDPLKYLRVGAALIVQQGEGE